MDQFDRLGRRRASDTYAGQGAAWAAERRSYADDYATELRIEKRGKVRGFFTSKGEPKDLLRLLLDLKARRAQREKEVREYKLSTGDVPTKKNTRFIVTFQQATGQPCPSCGRPALVSCELPRAAVGGVGVLPEPQAIVPPAPPETPADVHDEADVPEPMHSEPIPPEPREEPGTDVEGPACVSRESAESAAARLRDLFDSGLRGGRR